MQTPLTDEERKAKEARLRELRSELEGRGHPSTASAGAQQHEQQEDVPGYDEGSECSNDSDEDFFTGAENAAGVCMFAEPMEEPLGHTLETSPCVRRGIVGDFELLRLAKMGDLVSFREFAALTSADPTTFRDNHGRNAMHYAADSGNIALLQHLIDSNVPFTTDEKKMTPVDIATLNQYNDVVKLLAETFPQAAELVKSYEEVLELFAVPPPRFTMTKPAPPIEENSRPRAFWKAERTASATASADITVSQLTDAHHSLILRALSGSELAQEGHGFHSWLPPAEPAVTAAVLPRAKVVGALRKPNNGDGKEEDISGLVMAVPLGGSVALKSGGARVENPFLITQLALHPALRGANRTPLLLEEMHKLLLSSGATTAVFRSYLQLPIPAVGLVKWSRRSIAPGHVFKRRYATEVFPDFFQYDDVLRADIITKNALTKSFCDNADRCARWELVDRKNTEQLHHLHSFITSQAETLFDVAYLTQSVDDLLTSIVGEGLSSFVHRPSTGGGITDVVVLRLRPGGAGKGESQELNPLAAVCVYAMFSSFKGPAKAEEVLALACSLKAETVFIPNMFGFLDSDLSKAMFEELLHLREYLYMPRAVTDAAVRATAMSKVAIPCFFI
ncbi:Ankyrin repeats (3 copies) [Trypanosoma brucei equiperdum]|uniref:Ankyrin repeats (3 copies) n=1 Tax=Trypanosoma brucei equiperdum TaxID=630700 RepID=A0A3L6LAH2_9TRYP|nr:Ankyrin repeats (3 copies) [Trypanosoma brucei equiperdum]